MTRPPGQCRRKLADVNVVSRGRNQCHARKNHVKSNKNTTPGPKPNWREFMKTNPDRVEICFFFQILQMLEELGKGRGTFLICYAPNM